MTEYSKIEFRQDTAANWASNNPILAQGEPGIETDTRRIKIGDGVSTWLQLSYAEELQVANQLLKGTYEGVDLAVKFAAEITAGNYATTYDWLHARIQAHNYSGINLLDYFTVDTVAGTVDGNSVAAKSRKCTIAGFDMYKGCGDNSVMGNTILIYAGESDYNIAWNTENNNNGTETNQNPYLASKIHAVLCGIDNSDTNYIGSVGFNAEGAGYLQLFPQDLQGYMVDQRICFEKRYSATAALDENNGNIWANRGKLFIPSEIEVYGYQAFSAPSKGSNNNPARGPWDHFPIYQIKNRMLNNTSGRPHRWLCSVIEGTHTHACSVHSNGFASAHNTSYATIRAPLFFYIG